VYVFSLKVYGPWTVHGCHHSVLNPCWVFKGCSTVLAAAGLCSVLFCVFKWAGYVNSKNSLAPAELWSVVPWIFIPQFSLPDGFWILACFPVFICISGSHFTFFSSIISGNTVPGLPVRASPRSACCCPFMCCPQYVRREAGHLAIKKQNKTSEVLWMSF